MVIFITADDDSSVESLDNVEDFSMVYKPSPTNPAETSSSLSSPSCSELSDIPAITPPSCAAESKVGSTMLSEPGRDVPSWVGFFPSQVKPSRANII